MRIMNAEFVSSWAAGGILPAEGVPEVALVGRSNVGKSSLINTLVQRKRLAYPSATPGKTRLANYYRVELAGVEAGQSVLHLVDLPGYGFARAPGSERGRFDELVTALLARNRPELRGALLVVDARHPGLDNDLAAWEWLGAVGVPRRAVATKADKLSRNQLPQALAEHGRALGERPLAFSIADGAGREELWRVILALVA